MCIRDRASTEKEVTDITKMSDDEIKEAMKKEPAWGTTITAEYDGGCLLYTSLGWKVE